jgi:hypothetical protein
MRPRAVAYYTYTMGTSAQFIKAFLELIVRRVVITGHW